jgi:ABC-type dipeptide/oligopeptide/nickel transport system ATPase component
MIAMAIACNPRLLIADEPTTALDVTIQAQILDLLRACSATRGMALVLITHDLGVVAETLSGWWCMYAGRWWKPAAADLFATRATPTPPPCWPPCRKRGGRTPPGDHPGGGAGPVRPPAGCLFAPRCAFAAGAAG